MNESTLWLALGWTMLHSLWSGLALGVLVALGRLALSGARPTVRYGFLCAALAVLAALPVVLFALAPGTPVRAAIGSSASSASGPLLFGLGEAPAGSWTRALIPWLPYLWTIGSSVYLVLLMRGLAGTSRLRRRACAALDRVELSVLCASLADELGVARRVLVRVCDEVASPLLVGIARPLIVLPSAVVARCSPEQIEMVLLHELAHVRRWDNLVQLAQRVVQAVLFYQPAVWLVSSWIDLEREHSCDAVVLARTKRPRAYAQTLLALADAQRGAPALALSMAKRPLLARIERILRTQEPTGMQAKTTALALAAALAIGWTTLAPLTPAEAGPQRRAAPRYVRVEAPAAPEGPRAPHPIGLPTGTDCAACHVTPIAGPSPHVPDVFEVHADLPASAKCSDCHVTSSTPAPPAAQSDGLDRLRAQERELRRLLGEVERLRAELEALRRESSAPPHSESPFGLSTTERGLTLPPGEYDIRTRVSPTPNTQLPGAAPQPTNPLRVDRRRYVPGAPLPAPTPLPAPRVRTLYVPGASLPQAAPRADAPRARLRTRYAPESLWPEVPPEPALRTRAPRSSLLFDTRLPAPPAGLPQRATIYPAPPADAPPEPVQDSQVPILCDLPLLGELFAEQKAPAPDCQLRTPTLCRCWAICSSPFPSRRPSRSPALCRAAFESGNDRDARAEERQYDPCVQSEYDVVVIGGGVHGLATLWHLGRLGAGRCALVERFRIGHAHGSSHGRTRITRSVYEDEQWVRLMQVARDEDWPRLERDAGARLIDPCDGCFLGVGGESFGAYVRAVASAEGIEHLDVVQAQRRFPQFRYDDVVGALRDRTAGVIHADDTLVALERLVRAGGAEVLEETRVLAIERAADPLVLKTERGELRAKRVVVTAGAWTGALVPELRAELAPIRQTVAYYRLGGAPSASKIGRFPVWAALGDGENAFHYGLPESAEEGVKLSRHETVGRTDDPDALDVPASAAELAHLDAVARARFAAPVEARLASERCFYTNTADEGFRVECLADDPRIVVGAACSGHGFKFAPLVGRELAQLATA